MKTKAQKRIELMREALSEKRIETVSPADQDLVDELCEIIGSLHRSLENSYRPKTSYEIEEWVSVQCL
jgi:hypothetical protein